MPKFKVFWKTWEYDSEFFILFFNLNAEVRISNSSHVFFGVAVVAAFVPYWSKNTDRIEVALDGNYTLSTLTP